MRGRGWGAFALLAVASVVVARCVLSRPQLERPARTAEVVGVVASVSDDRGRIRLEDGTTVTVVDQNDFFDGSNAVAPGDLLFAGSKPERWLTVMSVFGSCPTSAPFSTGWIGWVGNGYIDFKNGLRVPQAPNFAWLGERLDPGRELNGPVCLDSQGRAVEYLGGGV